MKEWWFDVKELDVENLLMEWRWLCPQHMALVARTAFGGLFLRDKTGAIFWLEVDSGQLTRVAESEHGFLELLPAYGSKWFAEDDERSAAQRGFNPGLFQCIGFRIPLVFREGPHDMYIADLYEYVWFLGNLHRQIANVPDGGKVRLIVKPSVIQ